MTDQWIPVTEKPLTFYDDNQWWLTDDGEKEFIAAVELSNEKWWVRHCYIENGRLMVKGDEIDDDHMAGWEVRDVTHWQPIPEPPQTQKPGTT